MMQCSMIRRGMLFIQAGLLICCANIGAVAADDVGEPIRPIDITVHDGDTIQARGRTVRLMGFDAPEIGRRAQCGREREHGTRAITQLKTIIAGAGLTLKLVPCACQPGTAGTPACNDGNSCGQLYSYGRDVAGLMIQYTLAKPYVCGQTSCPQRAPWC